MGYSLNETWELEFGYKGLWIDYDEGKTGARGRFAYDTVTHGPLLGLEIHLEGTLLPPKQFWQVRP